MSNTSKRIWIWVLGFIGFVVALAACLILHYTDDKKYDSIVSIVGSVASLAGIVVAIGQILSVKSKTESINKALDKTMTQMENLTIFADINKHSQYVNEVEEYIRSRKYEQALITYKDLKDRLNQLYGYVGNRDDLKDIHNQLQKLIDNAGNDVKTLHETALRNSSYMIDGVRMVGNLEEIKTFLEQTSGEIKSRRDEKRPN